MGTANWEGDSLPVEELRSAAYGEVLGGAKGSRPSSSAKGSRPSSSARSESRARANAYAKRHQLSLRLTEYVNNCIQRLPKDPFSDICIACAKHGEAHPCFANADVIPSRRGDALTLKVRIRVCRVACVAHSQCLSISQGEEQGEEQTKGQSKGQGKGQGKAHDASNAADTPGPAVVAAGIARVLQALSGLHVYNIAAWSGVCLQVAEAYGEHIGMQIAEAILRAAANSKDLELSNFLRWALQIDNRPVASELQYASDLTKWRKQRLWPEFCFPLAHGGDQSSLVSPAACLAVGISFWATPDPIVQEHYGVCEWPEGFLLASQEGEDAVLDAEEQDSSPEFSFPPLNAAKICKELAHHIATEFRKGIGPKCRDAHGRPLCPPLAESLQHLDAALTASHAPCSKAEYQPQSPSRRSPVVPGESVYVVLHCAAGAAFDVASGLYEIERGSKLETMKLAQWYVELLGQFSFVSVLIEPFSRSDPSERDGYYFLSESLPNVELITGAGHAMPQAADEARETILARDQDGVPSFRPPSRAPDIDDSGFPARLGSQHHLGMATVALLHSVLEVPPGRSTVFHCPDHCLQQMNVMDAMLILPCHRRFLILEDMWVGAESEPVDPKKKGKEDPKKAHHDPEPSSADMVPTAFDTFCGFISHRAFTVFSNKSEVCEHVLTSDVFVEGLANLGFSEADSIGPSLFQLLDMSNSGTLSSSELELLSDYPAPATFDCLDSLRQFIISHVDCRRGAEGALRDFFIRADSNGSGHCNFREFKRALSDLGYCNGDDLSLFIALDVARTGTLDYPEYSVIALASAWHHCKCVENVRDALVKAFGSVMQGFRTMDANGSGRLSIEEWSAAIKQMEEPLDPRQAETCFAFMDMNRNQMLTKEEFTFLMGFEKIEFLKQLVCFNDALVDEFGDSSAAFQKWCHGQVGLTPHAFLDHFKVLSPRGVHIDPLVIYNFLDANGGNSVSRHEFALLSQISSLERLAAGREAVIVMLEHIRKWLAKQDFDWTGLHGRIMTAGSAVAVNHHSG